MLLEQGDMYENTQKYIEEQIKGQNNSESTNKNHKAQYEEEKINTKKKIEEIEKKVAELTEEVENAVKLKEDYLIRIQKDKELQEKQLREKDREAEQRLIQKGASNEIRNQLNVFCNAAKGKGKKKK